MRAGGAGIPAFFTRTGAGTMVETGGVPIKNGKDLNSPLIVSDKKESRNFDGKDYIMERSIVGDFALIKAWKADEKGNLIFRKTARNFNPDCAVAGKICIAEVEEIVPLGELNPNEVHLPSVYVQRIVKGERY